MNKKYFLKIDFIFILLFVSMILHILACHGIILDWRYLCLGMGTIWIISTYIFKNLHKILDPFAPPIMIPIILFFSSMSVPLFVKTFQNYEASTSFNINQVNLVSHLTFQSVSSFIIGFYIGTLVTGQQKLVRRKYIENYDLKMPIKASKYFNIILFVGILCALVGLGFTAKILYSRGYGYMQYEQNNLYYFANALSSLLIFPSTIGAYYCHNLLKRGKKNNITNSLIVIYLIVAILSGLRMRVLTILLIVMLIRNYYVEKIKTKKILLFLPILIIFCSWQLIYRTKMPLSMLSDPTFALRSFSYAIGSSGIIISNLTKWFPLWENFLLGKTYIHGVFNLLPGFLFGGSQYRPFLSGSFIYKSLFELGIIIERTSADILNPHQGYGFSMIGESFINFGLWGPLIIFVPLGIMLGKLYKYLFTNNHKMTLFYFLIMVTIIPGTRSDFSVFLKFLFYGWIIFYFAPFMIINQK